MKIVVIRAATSSTSLLATTFCAAGTAVGQWAGSAEAAYAAAGRNLRRAVSCRSEALKHRLDEFVLELLAAIVLIALFMAMTDSATREHR